MQRKQSANVPTNNVQAPSKYQKIVIIKHMGDSSKTIFNNPVKFTQALMESPFIPAKLMKFVQISKVVPLLQNFADLIEN